MQVSCGLCDLQASLHLCVLILDRLGVAFGLGKHVEVVPVGSVMKLRKVCIQRGES